MEQKWANKLTNEELELISETYYPLLKKGAMQKVQGQLTEVGEVLQQVVLLDQTKPVNGYKISRGENYMDLPYLVLDYPKIPGAGFNWLCRVVFWWGKYTGLQFFINQHTTSKVHLLERLSGVEHLFVLTDEQLWNNDKDSSSYKSMEQLSATDLENIGKLPYLKLMQVIPIKKPADLFSEARGFYLMLLREAGLAAQ